MMKGIHEALKVIAPVVDLGKQLWRSICKYVIPYYVGLLVVLNLLVWILYIVPPDRQVVMLRFGEPLYVQTKPGMHFKMLFDNPVKISNEVHIAAPVSVVMLTDSNRIIAPFGTFTISDPIQFLSNAKSFQQVNKIVSTLISEAAQALIVDLNGDVTDKIEQRVREQLDELQLGVSIVGKIRLIYSVDSSKEPEA
jgi:membrane protease subunit HflC